MREPIRLKHGIKSSITNLKNVIKKYLAFYTTPSLLEFVSTDRETIYKSTLYTDVDLVTYFEQT